MCQRPYELRTPRGPDRSRPDCRCRGKRMNARHYLPAHAAVLAAEALAMGEMLQVDDDLVLAAASDEFAHDRRSPQANHDDVGLVDQRPGLWAHERPDVRNGFIDVSAVGADETRDVDLR